jgi:uridine kinase
MHTCVHVSMYTCVHVCCCQVDPADVVIVEGILVLHVPELREQLNMKVYVDTGVGVTGTGLCAAAQHEGVRRHRCGCDRHWIVCRSST